MSSLPKRYVQQLVNLPSYQNCTEKSNSPYIEREKNQIIDLTIGSHCATVGATESEIQCNVIRDFRSARERWWFIVASKCNSVQASTNRSANTMITCHREIKHHTIIVLLKHKHHSFYTTPTHSSDVVL